jgi:protein-S-isoprenylcysteine O-methyltransferase Ste14
MSDASPAEIADLRRPQRGRKAILRGLAALGAIAGIFVASAWPPDGGLHLGLEWSGYVLILICIAGRTWCSLYIGNNKVRELVMTGPYSVSRNPLYVFSILGGIGVGAMFGSFVFAAATGAIVFAVFRMIARREESLLTEIHGDAFRRYCERVPRFWPRLSVWQDSERLTIKTKPVYATFLDSLFFLAAFPLAEAAEWIQQSGWVHPLAFVP